MRQRYVSNELIHFVGRSAQTLDAQFATLRAILESCELRARYLPAGFQGENLHEAKRVDPEFGLQKPGDLREGPVNSSIPGSLMSGTQVSGCGLCFCDIPILDLGIHMSHYSPFGISFRKSFVAANGATPVFYVARDAIVGDPSRDQQEPLAGVMDMLGKDLFFLRDSFMMGGGPDVPDASRKPLWILTALDRRVLAMVKGFNAVTVTDDDQNYYMEREWRMLRSLIFTLEDVYRIVLPEAYAKRFREAFPSYVGQLTYAESVTES